jgi:hypothetical protein
MRVHRAIATIEAEMRKTRAGGKSELMDILTVYNWPELLGPLDRDPALVKHKAVKHGNAR